MDLNLLRQAAAKRLYETPTEFDAFGELSANELVHELRVHQAELEMQNDELRRTERNLEESLDRLTDLFDFAPVGYLTLTRHSRIAEANLTLSTMLEMDRSSLIGKRVSQLVTAETSSQLHRHLLDLENCDEKLSCDVTMLKVDSSLVHVRLDSIRLPGGTCSIAISDISKIVALNHQKQASDDRLRVVCHAMPIPIAHIDRAGTYQFSNSVHTQWFQRSNEMVRGQSVRYVMGEDTFATFQPNIARVLTGEACVFELTLSAQNEPRMCKVHFIPDRGADDEVNGYYELITDISDTKQLESASAQRLRLEARLQVLSKRQREIFDQILQGSSNKRTTLLLGHSERTVERERRQILNLLEMDSINELLITFAFCSNLADPDSP